MLPFVPFGVARTELRAGDRLLVFTDGVTEAKGPSGFFGEERLVELAAAHRGSVTELMAALHDVVAAHVAGMEPSDDTTIVAVGRL